MRLWERTLSGPNHKTLLRRYKDAAVIITTVVLAITFFSFFSGCRSDECEPPFDAGVGSSGVFLEGPIEAGKIFGVTLGVYNASITDLKDVQIEIALPPEVEIRSMLQPGGLQKMTRSGNTLKWRGDIERSLLSRIFGVSKEQSFMVWAESGTNWKKWSYPIRATISLDYVPAHECRSYPAGYYGKTMIWSHGKYRNPDWETAPDGYVQSD